MLFITVNYIQNRVRRERISVSLKNLEVIYRELRNDGDIASEKEFCTRYSTKFGVKVKSFSDIIPRLNQLEVVCEFKPEGFPDVTFQVQDDTTLYRLYDDGRFVSSNKNE